MKFKLAVAALVLGILMSAASLALAVTADAASLPCRDLAPSALVVRTHLACTGQHPDLDPPTRWDVVIDGRDVPARLGGAAAWGSDTTVRWAARKLHWAGCGPLRWINDGHYRVVGVGCDY